MEPHLLLISNKCAMKGASAGVWDIEACTKMYFDSHGEKIKNGLFQLHKTVNCMCLPNWKEGELKKVRGALVSEPVGANKYSEQIEKLQNLLRRMYRLRVHERVKSGFCLSERTWLELLKLVVDDFPTTSHASQVKQMTIIDKFYHVFSSTGSEEIRAAHCLFSQMVNRVNSNILCGNMEVQKDFLMCREAAFVSLAAKVAMKIKEQGLSSLQAVDSYSDATAEYDPTSLLKRITSHWIDVIIEMDKLVEEQRICSSVYTRVDTWGNKLEVRCTSRHKFHGSTHRNPTILFGPEADYGVVQRLFYHLAAFVGVGFPAVWKGKFEPKRDDFLPLPLNLHGIIATLKGFLEMDEGTVLKSVAHVLSTVISCEPLPVISLSRMSHDSKANKEKSSSSDKPRVIEPHSLFESEADEDQLPPTHGDRPSLQRP